MLRAAVFLDRDGTINVEKNYIYRYEDWEWMAGQAAGVKSFLVATGYGQSQRDLVTSELH